MSNPKLSRTDGDRGEERKAPLQFARRVGCLLGGDVRPCVYAHGSKYFVGTAFEDQVEMFDVEHLRPAFALHAPWKVRHLQCFDETAIISDGANVRRYIRNELKAEYACTEGTIQALFATNAVVLLLLERSVEVLDSQSLTLCRSIKLPSSAVWMHPLRHVRDSIATGHVDGSVCTWNVRTGAKGATQRLSQIPSIVAPGPDDSVAVFGWADGRVQVYDFEAGHFLADFKTPKALVNVAFRQDSLPQMLTFHDDSISVWSFKDESIECTHTQPIAFGVVHAEFLPGKPIVLCFGENVIQELGFEGSELKLIRSRAGIPADVDFVQFYAEGNFNEMLTTNVLAMANQDSKLHLAIHNIFADNRGFELSQAKAHLPDEPCSRVALFDRRDVPWGDIVTVHGKSTFTWSVPERKIYPDSRQQFDSPITALCISPCGNYYGVGCLDGSVHVLVLQSHRRISSKALPTKGPHATTFLAFDASGRGLLWVHADGQIVFSKDFRTHPGESIVQVDGASSKLAYFNVDSNLLFVADADMNIVAVDMEYKRVARVFSGHVGPITALTASNDGRWLFSCGHDCTIRLWDITSGFECHVVKCSRVPRALALSPHGRFLVSAHAHELGLTLWSFDHLKVRHQGRTSLESFAEDADMLSALEGLKITPMREQHKWQAILNWRRIKAQAAPKVVINKDPDVPFFLSDMALEELKRKQAQTVTKPDVASDLALRPVDFDWQAEVTDAGKSILALSPSQIHSLFHFIEADEQITQMAAILLHMIRQAGEGKHPYDLCIAIVKVFVEYHGARLRTSQPAQASELADAVEAVQVPIEQRLRRILGELSFVTGSLL